MIHAADRKKAELHLEREDDDYVTTDDLRVIIKELKECWQLGDTNVMREARSALLTVLRNSAKRLLGDHYRAIRSDL
jgi:hypothetical protein